MGGGFDARRGCFQTGLDGSCLYAQAWRRDKPFICMYIDIVQGEMSSVLVDIKRCIAFGTLRVGSSTGIDEIHRRDGKSKPPPSDPLLVIHQIPKPPKPFRNHPPAAPDLQPQQQMRVRENLSIKHPRLVGSEEPFIVA